MRQASRRTGLRRGQKPGGLQVHGTGPLPTLTEIENIIGVRLPLSAYNYRAWWANNEDRTLARQ